MERYLHANANLWFTTFDEPVEPDQSVPEEAASDRDAKARYDWSKDSYRDDETDEEWDEFEQDFNEDFDEPMTLPTPPWSIDYTGPQEPITRVVTLRQKRRMRSKETHYIDHPVIGILIHIEPLPDAANSED